MHVEEGRSMVARECPEGTAPDQENRVLFLTCLSLSHVPWSAVKHTELYNSERFCSWSREILESIASFIDWFIDKRSRILSLAH